MISLEDQEKIYQWRNQKLTIVYTQGVFDLFHKGHLEYLKNASKLADILIVGVDSDKKVKLRKGTNRPIEKYSERAKKISNLQYVNLVFEKTLEDERWSNLKSIAPDYWVISKNTYSLCDLLFASQYVRVKTVELPRNPTVSTTDLIVKIQKKIY